MINLFPHFENTLVVAQQQQVPKHVNAAKAVEVTNRFAACRNATNASGANARRHAPYDLCEKKRGRPQREKDFRTTR